MQLKRAIFTIVALLSSSSTQGFLLTSAKQSARSFDSLVEITSEKCVRPFTRQVHSQAKMAAVSSTTDFIKTEIANSKGI
jgi:hypothetical protein